eukprot:Em0017g334a
MQFVDGEDRTSWSVVVGKLDGLCAPRTSKHVTWDKFFQLKQEGRSLDQFMMLIRKQANDCEFGEMKENLMLHVLIRGVDNDRMRRRLLETEKLDLAKAIQMCQVMETTLADLQHMSKKPEAGEEEGPVASVRTRKGFRGKENYVQKEGDGAKNPAAGQQGRRTGERKGCSRCGMVHPPRQCPAFGKQCLKCQKYNHFAKVCRGSDKPTNLVEEAEMDFDSEEEQTRSRAEDVFQIQVEKVGRKLLAKVVFQVERGTKQVVCQLDTAASCNVMTKMDHEQLGKPKLKKSRTRLIMWCRLPFGLSSAPEEFQRRLQNALHGIEGVAVVADDILVFGVGTTMEDAIQNHDEALLRVLKRGPPLQFEAEQTKAATSLARIVIHRTQDFGVRCALGPSQSNGYQPMPAPTSAPEVRRFLGMCNYLSRFIPKLSQVSEPLRALTESNKDFVWGKVEQEHFEQIKALIKNFCRQEIFHTKHGELEAQEFSTVDETDYVHVKDEKIEEVRQAAKVDEEQKLLRQVIVDGWPPSIREVPIGIRCYWNFRDTLTVSDGVIYKGDQIAVPTSLRETYLGKLHASHLGKESTLRRAKDAVYWPNMAKDIEGMISKCRICEEDSPAQSKEKLQAHSLSQQPWGKVGTDLFEYKGQDYLVVVDYLSDFFEVSELAQVSAGAVIRVLKEQFARHGVPVIVQSDGGPQFVSREFSDFATEWGFTHTVSSPYHSSSNKKAESAVKIAKRLFRRSSDRFLALLEWRNNPTVSINLSPCQRLFSRRTRGLVPVTPEKLQPATEQQAWKLKLQRQNIIQTQAESKGRNLRPLQVGKPVLVQDLRARKTTWVRGVCEKQLSDRSFLVRVEDRLLRRNRRFLKPSVHSPDRNAEEMSVEIVLKR